MAENLVYSPPRLHFPANRSLAMASICRTLASLAQPSDYLAVGTPLPYEYLGTPFSLHHLCFLYLLLSQTSHSFCSCCCWRTSYLLAYSLLDRSVRNKTVLAASSLSRSLVLLSTALTYAASRYLPSIHRARVYATKTKTQPLDSSSLPNPLTPFRVFEHMTMIARP